MTTTTTRRPIDTVLERLDGVREHNGYWTALCPAHGDENNPSLSISEGEDGRVLLKCFTGCTAEEVVEALDLEMRDIFAGGKKKNRNKLERREGEGESFVDDDKAKETPHPPLPPDMDATVQPCTLENYATYKRLPVPFLKKQGLSQHNNTLRFPYKNEANEEKAVRRRTALTGNDNFR